MTVAELIKILQDMPQDSRVVIDCVSDGDVKTVIHQVWDEVWIED